MGFAENMRILSGINCGAQSLASYAQARADGVPRGPALGGLFVNTANGLARNELAYDMQRHGNPLGNAINLYAGYGNPVSNAVGTYGMLAAYTPWMFFNCPGAIMSYDYGYYMGGMNYWC